LTLDENLMQTDWDW